MASEEPHGPFAGKVALVTGAGGDIGRAISDALATSGASVGLVGRRRSTLIRALRGLGEGGHQIFVTDLAADSALRQTVRGFLRQFGRLDVLVHSNGTHSSDLLESARVRDFDRLWTSNVRSPFLLTQLLLPALRASAGQIVFVNSSAVLGTRAGVGHFAATQHALRSIADTFRAELNPDGIRVLSVYPGRTATHRQRRIFERERRRYVPERLLQPSDLARVIVESLSLPRTAEVTDIQIRPLLKH
jgi:NADP-dependent 3-hydroxy acid dehydrogenase YdfG